MNELEKSDYKRIRTTRNTNCTDCNCLEYCQKHFKNGGIVIMHRKNKGCVMLDSEKELKEWLNE